MLKHRIIPALLLQNAGLVKTFKFKNPKYVGDPINAIRIFNDKEVDELMVLDILASKEGREPNYNIIERIAGECFMPLCYGGGVRTVEQARRIFSLGVISVDIKKDWLGRYQLYRADTAKLISTPWQGFIQQAVEYGAGEVLLNAVDRDGTMSGPDLDLIRQCNENLQVPLIAVGGIGSLEDIKLAVSAGASAVAAGAFFVFHGPHRAVLITYPLYQELEGLFDN